MTQAPPPPRSRASLASRIIVATVSVALLAALATGVVAFQLVRQVTIQQSRDVLRSTVLVITDAPARERVDLVEGLTGTTKRGIHLSIVRADGTTVPATATAIPERALRRIQNTGSVSESAAVDGHTLLIEGERLPSGAAVVATQDFSLVQSATARLLWRFAVAVGLGVVVAVGVGILVARIVSGPLRRAAHSARLLAGGQRGVIVPGASGGPGVREVDDIERALAGLDDALAASEARQHEFLLSISHEIRTPLTAIRGYADALADGLVPASALPDVGRTLVTETGRLDAFTRDLLELARLEADDFRIRPEALFLGSVAHESAAAWSARAAALGVTLTVVTPPGEDAIVSDPMRVRQLIDGLVENALRASPAGSVITLRVTGGGGAGAGAGIGGSVSGWSRISVRDQGPGLTAADTAEAFERGLLADRYRAQRAVGTGLGLSIAARLVRRLGGSITAARPEGGGAEFVVTLPRAAPGADAGPRPPGAVPPQGFEP